MLQEKMFIRNLINDCGVGSVEDVRIEFWSSGTACENVQVQILNMAEATDMKELFELTSEYQ